MEKITLWDDWDGGKGGRRAELRKKRLLLADGSCMRFGSDINECKCDTEVAGDERSSLDTNLMGIHSRNTCKKKPIVSSESQNLKNERSVDATCFKASLSSGICT